MFFIEGKKQVGFMKLSKNDNKEARINEARQQGYIVLDCGEHIEMYAPKKKESNG